MWKEYQKFVIQTLNLEVQSTSSNEANDSRLESSLYTSNHILKSRETIISSGETEIYNNIVYPKTGSNLPSLGMDLMAFFEKKVIIVFDFQHPTPHYDFDNSFIESVLGDMKDNTPKTIRFFEPGNHFSRYIYVRKCTTQEIPDHLDAFKRYVLAFNEMLETEKPTGEDTTNYREFDKYMLELDPVAGYMASKFGKEFSEEYVNNFLFPYAHINIK